MNRLELGTRLRSLRTGRGISLSQLGAATQISSSFLSLVESGKSDITISRLLRLSDFFDVDLDELVEGGRVERHRMEVIRDGEGSVLARAQGITTRFLGHSRWQLTPWIGEYGPGGTIDIGEGARGAREILHHHELLIYVMTGTFEIAVRGEEPFRVGRGDAVLIRGGADRAVNVGRGIGRLLVVSFTPASSR
jgi:transcriptional regulator with XRE-family HTH domain